MKKDSIKKFRYLRNDDRSMFENNKGATRDSDKLNDLDSSEIETMGRLAAEA